MPGWLEAEYALVGTLFEIVLFLRLLWYQLYRRTTNREMIYSLGHSTHSQEAFIKLVQDFDVVMDTRSHPTSHLPQFRLDNLRDYLGTRYVWEPRLGGWSTKLNLDARLKRAIEAKGVDIDIYLQGAFPKQIIAQARAESSTPTWTNRGLYDYSYCMLLPEWLTAADELIVCGRKKNIVIFCAEGAWFKCHRSMICDYIVWRGEDVYHLSPYMTKTWGQKCSRKQHRAVIGNRLERYAPEIIRQWVRWAARHPLII